MKITEFSKTATLACLIALMSACGGGSGGGSGSDTKAPSLVVDFPPVNALVDESSTPALTVRGRASDDTKLAKVRIAGVTVERDGENWIADVPLKPGINTIAVIAVDAAGNENTAEVRVTRVPYIPGDSRAATFDKDRNRLYVVDSDNAAIYMVDPESGDIQILSGAGKGDGSELGSILGMTLDHAGQRLLVADLAHDVILGVALDTGERTRLSSADIGEGPRLSIPYALALDALSAATVYVVDNGLRAVLEVDLQTGNRRFLSYVDASPGDGDDSIGTGEPFVGPKFVVHDADRGRLLVTDNDRIVAVDIDSGDRELFIDMENSIETMVLDGGHLLIGDREALYMVDVATGAMTLVSGNGRGAGAQMLNVASVTTLAANGRIHVVDRAYNGVHAIDPATGDRVLLPSPVNDADIQVIESSTIDVNEFDNSLLVYARQPSGKWALASIDLGSGASTVLAEPEDVLAGTDLDIASGTLWAVSIRETLLAVDIVDGEIRSVSGQGAGSGPEFSGLRGLAVDSSRGRAYAVDSGPDAILSVGLGDGAREAISGSERGAGPVFNLPTEVEISAAGDVLFVGESASTLDGVSNAIYRVDVATGNRSLLTKLFGDPLAFSVVAGDPTVLTNYGLEAVNPQSGETHLLSGRNSFSGDLIGRGPFNKYGLNAKDVSCADEPRICYLATGYPGGITVVDQVSGDRVFFVQ